MCKLMKEQAKKDDEKKQVYIKLAEEYARKNSAVQAPQSKSSKEEKKAAAFVLHCIYGLV